MKPYIPSLLLFFAILVGTAAAQTSTPTPTQAEKTAAQKEIDKRVVEMLDQVASDAATLKLAQNRAVVFAMTGDLYWKFDEKRARELFRNSGSEIITANGEAEKEKKQTEDPFAGMFEFGSDPRATILPLIAKHDADLALEIMAQTRSAKLIEALAKATQPNTKEQGMFEFNPDQYRARQEIALEQRFAVLAAEQNPDKAIKLIKDSLAKGISYNVKQLLEKLYEKDKKKAQSLADDVVAKIVDTDLSKKIDDLQTAIQFLQSATNPNAPKAAAADKSKFSFSDSQLKDIANKLANTYLQTGQMSLQVSMSMVRVMKDLEKFIPERMAVLKQKQADVMKSLPPEFSRIQQQEKIWNPNSTPEDILANWSKYNEMERSMAGGALATKISQVEDDARAKSLIDQIPDEKIRDQARERYESAKIGRASAEGKLDDAKKMIANLTKKKTQIQKYVALAIEFYKKGGDKDKETAAGLMRDAKALTSEYPEDEDELNDLMEIVRGYAIVNPDDSFRLFEPVVDQINDYLQASAILSKYNKRNRNFKKGELVLKMSGYSADSVLLFRYIKQMQMMGKADLNRMATLTDHFQRSDARTIVKLFVVQGVTEDDKKGPTAEGAENEMMFFGFGDD